MKTDLRNVKMLKIVFFLFFGLFFHSSAYAGQGVSAYIDPGTGSLLIQVLIGIVCGGLFCIKMFWNSLKGFFGRLFGVVRKKENE